eukprot:TRINITY_DN1757_c0_g1_i1.p1 TRINITY_DN1757_c0_g1~~TRINITY_DN1757_c0_g1_i1.p1  ORF type:complete len:118 (-),score=43.39 TRINITY_DN1757_c0_g1_i1:10-363(-)
MGKCSGTDCGCTLEEDPLCCWKVTYANECMAKCAGISDPDDTCKKGQCSSFARGKGSDESDESKESEECACTKELNAICCSDEDGKRSDYDNPCLAECDGFSKPADKDEDCILGTCQ